MLLLVTDTSGKNSNVALAQVKEGHSKIHIVESVPLAGGTFSAQLIPQISALLLKHGYSKSDLAGFAVISGPGSFTGLRVGLAAIKALAEVLQKPIAAISLLEAVARSSRSRGRVVAALDAGRGEIYAGAYQIGGEEPGPSAEMQGESLQSREEFVAAAQAKVVVTPDAIVVDTLRSAGIPCERIAYPAAAVIARLGWERIQQGQTVRPRDLEANYIRRSDAEIFSKPRFSEPKSSERKS